MERGGETAHIDVRAFLDYLFHRRLLARDDDRLYAFLHALVTGNASPANLYAKRARQTESARHQKGHQRQLGALTIDHDVMTNENGKPLRLLELHRQRGDFPI